MEQLSGNSPKMTQMSSVSTTGQRKGGLRTMSFIILNESFEKVSSYGLMPNMIFYLMKDYHLDAATGTTVLLLWSAASNALAIVGAFLSDSCLGRFRVIALGSFSSLLGMIMLWLTDVVPETKPPSFCNPSYGGCKSATAVQLAFLFFSFGLMSIVKASKSLFTGFFQVLVVAFKNRNLNFPANNSDGCYHQAPDSELIEPTKSLRFLNKACIIGNQITDVKPDGSPSNPWKLCTVDQVESLKSLLKVIPMWSSCIMVQVTINQSTFTAIQASTMDRHITTHFQIPAGSFSVFLVLTLTIWVAMYDRLIVPLMAKHMGRPHGLGQNQRIGIGILVSAAAMAVSAGIERVRRRSAIREVIMSAMWLVPQQCLLGVAEAMNAVAQIELYYSHFSKNMGSLAMALFTLGMAAGNLVGSLIVKIVDGVTKGEGKESWVSSNPNKGHYDYYYWLLAILCFIDFFYFLVCCWVYGPEKEKETKLEGGAGASMATLA
ncbi:hypothetical protein NE237_028777 [Protea cynaroides]|uniref:Protein NRT1/ PTR FAMILY 1.2-like n=1 Tax=Protea cynaroides TaxID=273540 RepID=A0A9Q0GR01_9MAGN|nr:hypothetical protein NE237_028777 [Protea cynaroides]